MYFGDKIKPQQKVAKQVVGLIFLAKRKVLGWCLRHETSFDNKKKSFSW